ncbi:argininosuccinate lyase [Adlercreutzia sp. ZJ141]|uniref:argininosuccinate lyase n=1 Tax=Adlercreutzia sp. ZJ141 TaxID=2709406 RepID=UPI0013ED8E9E|nr:argininosuccinate lyase [Adlercreutzia sp. ZJ141]
MPALQVKDFPDDLYEELRECAAKECRSVSQQTVYGLREFLRMYKAHQSVKNALWAEPYVTDLFNENEDRERRKRANRRQVLNDRIDKLGSADVPIGFPDAAKLIRSMREERTDQILEAVGDLDASLNMEAQRDRA